MELSKANQGTALAKPSELSKKSKIVMLLATLGIRRQAKLDKEDYLVFASDLEKYELADIEAGIAALPPKRDGQTAFPDVDTILEAVRGVIRSRKSVKDSAAAKWSAYVERCKDEGTIDPDQDILERISAINEKFGLQKRKVIDTTYVQMKCPHCDTELAVAQNIRFWTSDDLRKYADTLDNLHGIAMKNAEVSA